MVAFFSALAKAYPKEAVKAFHEKPQPKHGPTDHGAPNFIPKNTQPGLFQPRQQYLQNLPAEGLPANTGNKNR